MVNNHVKPTKEELEANALKLAEEAEKLKAEEALEDEEKEEQEDEPEEVVDEPEEELEEEGDQEEDQEEEPEEEVKAQPKKTSELSEEEKDKKLRASTQEAQILYERNKQVHEAIEKAAEVPEPTEDELKTIFPDWDVMSEFERRMAKETHILNMRLSSITEVNKNFRESEAWQKKVDEFVEDPATLNELPELEGKMDEFRLFATKPTRRGVSFDVLVSSFLYEDSKARKPIKKGQQMPRGSAGQARTKPKSDKLSASAARNLRETNYNEYKRQLKAGKIDPLASLT